MKKWTCVNCKKTFMVPNDAKPRCGCVTQSRGLGDRVAKITKRFGVQPCGKCKERQAKLNDLVPYKRQDKTGL